MPGLGITLGRGGATTSLQDLQNADCILIEGSNMAEAHPVGFRHPMLAKEKNGAKLIHVDPRFTRTSALSDIYAPLRPGTDIAFLGGLINYVLQNERYFEEYVKAYTNAATIITEEFRDADVTGLFSGWDEETQQYDMAKWSYANDSPRYAASGGSQLGSDNGEKDAGSEADSSGTTDKEQEVVGQDLGGTSGQDLDSRASDETLQHERCVFQILKRHFSRYTPETVEKVCGTPKEAFLKVAETVCENSGRDRTTALVYSVGWTQHSTGVQLIRTAAILQLLLGNIGRPGGGIMALRGHATIQGSTDIATLYDILPGYLPIPNAKRRHGTWEEYLESETAETGWWSNFPKYATSLFKAWYGEAFDPARGEEVYSKFPRIDGDHSYYPTIMAMKDREVEGCFVFGQNFAVGGPHGKMAREALRSLEWLVVLDAYEIETATAWKLDGVDPQSCDTEVFLMPSGLVAEKDGSFTQTQRMLQWHDKAVEPPEDARSDAWFMYHLGRRIKELYADSEDPRDALIKHLTWDYPLEGAHDEPEIEAILKEISGYYVENGEPVDGFKDLRDDGTTACGGWIYCGSFAGGVNQTRRRKAQSDSEWGWAWPADRRTLYNRASADPEGKPWSERKKLVWWDEEKGEWTGGDVPDFERDKPPSYRPEKGAKGMAAIGGDVPFIMNEDGRGWLFAPVGLKDGPLPVHYEPLESPVPNALYRQQRNPGLKLFPGRPDNPYNYPEDPRYPHVVTTYRLTEHHTTGAMSRWNPWLNELQPELFCEISPELAQEEGIENAGWVTVETSRGKIHCKALVSDRIPVYRFDGRRVHTIGLPYHFGPNGLVTGDVVNDLLPVSLEANVSIHEAKAFTANIKKGRL
ncbi:Molybdopterin oxidoreductase [Rubrobacter radiotolerans]|uniref:Molybdopterin oxidoreductase n=1 Tax=Rubrobacter radiotolerans TaxID=42256 RepID=A0A023X707_RUBRA|nr:molybdopterin-dependent oxidoreductase [Rubrobacter radiotolerans]AHY47854.1 Molybdopterin oxidoreductase [Rubrobacter radiotolerans]MDX5892493.1 molybdopterin-dependent oxidoreductase [Rubrobacter radiotolerans]SMC07784.1 formate dehydrogenase major subunit [Rubrobacter radiotolerans DSM 5868]